MAIFRGKKLISSISGVSLKIPQIKDDIISTASNISSTELECRFYDFEYSINSSETGCVYWQKNFIDVLADQTLAITISNGKLKKYILQIFKFVDGDTNIVQTIKLFNNTDAKNFNFNKENISFDNGMKIKDKYSLSVNHNESEDFFESEIISFDSYKNIHSMEVI